MARWLAHGALGGLALGVSAYGCGLFLGTGDLSFDETADETTVTTSTQGTGASGGSPGTGGTSATTGGAGGVEPPGGLVNTGLLARYHLDEAASGTPPINGEDSAPAPLPLGMRYDGIMSWAEIDGLRALDFSTAGTQGDAFANVAATSNKIWLLHGSTRATVEAVVDVAEVGPSGSAIVYLGTDLTASGLFGLFIPDAAHVNVVLGPAGGGTFDVPITTLGRVVLHGVLDGSNLVLYVDGAPATPVSTTAVAVDLGATTHFMLGNTRDYAATMRGRIYYAALYTEALAPDEVTHNAQLLLASDDTPQ